MVRPSPSSIALGAVGGGVNVALVLALYARAGYPTLETYAGVSLLVVTGFVLGFVPAFVSAHTRLIVPAIGFLAALAGTVFVELTTPSPEWSELEGYLVVDGPTHVGSYANTWYVWLSLFLLAGVLECGIRQGYGIETRRLRNLPTPPFSPGTLAWVVLGFASLVGVSTVLLALRAGIRPPIAAVGVFVGAVGVTAVPLAAVLARGIVSPAILFAVLVPYVLSVEVFTTTDSPVHLLLFGPYAVVLVVAWVLEATVRSRVRGWDGGRFVSDGGT
ncbi:hypothetical protein EA462_08135 [Natrarchaeobius halalkaliphilus]|uniref:Uncharacterized protein n=1 Tax=Natrarchaeobius halalkaliphilus TaxID=1679091 RepID=A0A3N6M903_9EURY|nr:hypothetical protein [Natrarchaeobius halalkaliphilus]RQG89966.1 hypothetical protein EA462_08135 [Natrarchaeobius halalkaliphilus]